MIPTVKSLLDMDWHTCNVCNTQAYTKIQTATIQRLQTYLNYKNIRIHMLSAPFLPLFKSMQIKKPNPIKDWALNLFIFSE